MGLKPTGRQRAKIRIRKRLSGNNERPRISVFKSSKHTYAQIISDESHKTLFSASTLDEDVKNALKDLKPEKGQSEIRSSKSVLAATAVGLVLAEKAKKDGIKSVVFDRNGFVYHGRVRAVAEGARKGGLEF